MEKHPLHLKIPELQNSEEVSDAVEKRDRLENEKTPNDATERIDAYMDRLENIFLTDKKFENGKPVKERNLEMLKDDIYVAFISKKDVVIDEMLKNEQRIAFEEGHGRIIIREEFLDKEETQRQAEGIIKRQKSSLDEWMEYLTSDESKGYPTWFKYLVFSSITKLQALSKDEIEENGEKKTVAKFLKRNERTLRPFPDIFKGKLSKIYDKYAEFLKEGKTDKELKEYFNQKFATTYAEESLDQILNSSKEELEEIRGEWVKYNQGNSKDARALTKALENKYTDWCTEGISFAESQLQEGNFYVYYTYDKEGKPINPRVAIHCHGNTVGELKGIVGGKRQELETSMLDIATEKVGKELGKAEMEKYTKKKGDMKRLTAIDKKSFKRDISTGESVYLKPKLTKEDLIFLYEIDTKIDGFGNGKDPRISEL